MIDLATVGAFAALLMAQSAVVLLSVLMGGWLVFRTKRESHERLLQRDTPREPGVQTYVDSTSVDESEDDEDPVKVLAERYEDRAKAALRKAGF